MADYPDGTYPVDIVAQTLSEISVDVVAQSLAELNVDIVAQTLSELNVDLVAQSVGNINVDLVAQSVGNINVDLVAQTIGNILMDIKAQSVSVQNYADWGVQQGDDTLISGSFSEATSGASNWRDIASHTVTAGKTLRVYGVKAHHDTANKAFRLTIDGTEHWRSEVMSGDEYTFTVPQAAAAGIVVKLQVYTRPSGSGGGITYGFAYCVEE